MAYMDYFHIAVHLLQLQISHPYLIILFLTGISLYAQFQFVADSHISLHVYTTI